MNFFQHHIVAMILTVCILAGVLLVIGFFQMRRKR